MESEPKQSTSVLCDQNELDSSSATSFGDEDLNRRRIFLIEISSMLAALSHTCVHSRSIYIEFVWVFEL